MFDRRHRRRTASISTGWRRSAQRQHARVAGHARQRRGRRPSRIFRSAASIRRSASAAWCSRPATNRSTCCCGRWSNRRGPRSSAGRRCKRSTISRPTSRSAPWCRASPARTTSTDRQSRIRPSRTSGRHHSASHAADQPRRHDRDADQRHEVGGRPRRHGHSRSSPTPTATSSARRRFRSRRPRRPSRPSSGQTVILGGLITNESDRNHAAHSVSRRYSGARPAVPVRRRHAMTRTELLIIMTPFIIQNEEQIDWLNARETERMSWCIADIVNIHGPVGMSGNPAFNMIPSDVIFPDLDPTAPATLPAESIPTPGVPTPPTPGLPLPPPRRGCSCRPLPDMARCRRAQPPPVTGPILGLPPAPPGVSAAGAANDSARRFCRWARPGSCPRRRCIGPRRRRGQSLRQCSSSRPARAALRRPHYQQQVVR